MTKITLKGNQIKTIGKLPKVGKKAPKFKLTKVDLSTAKLKDFKGKKVLINITPSIDTGICANSLRKFNACGKWAMSILFSSSLASSWSLVCKLTNV